MRTRPWRPGSGGASPRTPARASGRASRATARHGVRGVDTTNVGTPTAPWTYWPTVIVTVPPFGSFPPVGLCDTTTPRDPGAGVKFTITLNPAPVSAAVAAPCVWPIVFGTSTSLGPLETNTRTADPRGTRIPVAGSVPIACPTGTVSLD